MSATDLKSLPGAEIVLPGIADLEAGHNSVNAIAVQCAATRLRRLGLTGGATAVLEGWRESTANIDVRFEPDSDAALSRIAEIKVRPLLAGAVEAGARLRARPR